LSEEFIVFSSALKAAQKHSENLSRMVNFQQITANPEEQYKSFYTRWKKDLIGLSRNRPEFCQRQNSGGKV
jgi:hypothetical protein